MFFALILLRGLPGVYGPIPAISSDTMEIWRIEESDSRLLDDYFVDDANELVDSLMGAYDIDMLDDEQCDALIPWLAAQIARKDLPERLTELYIKLREFCERAVTLRTGVIIEL